jgi:hypothetical protein
LFYFNGNKIYYFKIITLIYRDSYRVDRHPIFLFINKIIVLYRVLYRIRTPHASISLYYFS